MIKNHYLSNPFKYRNIPNISSKSLCYINQSILSCNIATIYKTKPIAQKITEVYLTIFTYIEILMSFNV